MANIKAPERSTIPNPTVAASGATGLAASGALAKIGHYRWTICALLFFATTISYVDRQVIGILGPSLQRDLGWNEQQFGDVVSWLTIGYGLGFLFAGRVMDRIGTRKGFAGAIVLWSFSAMAHALAATTAGFSAARFALGVGESGNFPAAIKTVAEWFPSRERALATGIFNAGSNVGAIVTPLMVPWIALNWGWRAAFITTGALGFLWLIAWLLIYRPPQQHPKCGAAELAHICSDPVEPTFPVKWTQLLRYRQTWAFALGKLMTDPIWWFYLYWLPKFLDARYGIKLAQVAGPLIAIYLVADVGSVFGGWLSGAFIKRGFSVNAARKTTMLIAALAIVPTMVAPSATNMWLAVAIVSVAAAAHQWWSANIFTLASDMFPQFAVGSVVGIGGFFGAFGGVLFQRATGWVLQRNGSNYTPIFVVCGLAYVAALLVIHLLAPRLQRVTIGPETAA
ncbi:MAG: major facilitator superfamily 1 [Gemmatimonadetes bacterium]|nr:major facilitator superfamily 1 [Gemmatimonadota bacterium]